jgi:hypothetical protein
MNEFDMKAVMSNLYALQLTLASPQNLVRK